MDRFSNLGELRRRLEAAGVYRHHEGAGWGRLALLMVVFGACVAAAAALPPWGVLFGAPIAALALATAAMLGHEGCHGSFSDRRWQNQLLAWVTFPLLSGLGAQYWKHKHNVRHHGHPNVSGQDPDIELWPMACNEEDYLRSSRPRRWFQRTFQAWAFWPFTLMLTFLMRASSIRFLFQKRRRRDTAWWLDVACLSAHYGLWLGAGSALFGLVPALLFYLAVWGLVGVILSLIFAPAHMGLPVVEGQNKGWLHQIETTRNLRVPPGSRWFFVGLDFQIEHHLFPRIPHQQLPKARDITRAWCGERGLPHRSVSYGEALASVHRWLREAWRTPSASPTALRAGWQSAA